MRTGSSYDLNRRQLMQGSLRLLGVLPLCCSTPMLRDECASYDGNTLVIDLEKASEIRRVGSAGAFADTGRNLNIIVAHIDKNRFVALDRSCTHGGAQCTYNHQRRTLQCTSVNHAEFDLKGTLLHGRTHGNLRSYAARRTGAVLRIQLDRKD